MADPDLRSGRDTVGHAIAAQDREIGPMKRRFTVTTAARAIGAPGRAAEALRHDAASGIDWRRARCREDNEEIRCFVSSKFA
jgi:hypothetical protein